jgi:hypothetical protein
MFEIAAVVFATGLIGLISLLAIGGPMARAAEREHGLAAARSTVKTLRSERGAARAAIAELDGQKQELANSLAVIRAELEEIEQKIGALPDLTYELVFELGAPEAGLQAFDYVLSRSAAYFETEKVAGPDRALWKQARTLRVWSRDSASAGAIADKRYPVQRGFIIRAALRPGVAGRQPAARG